LPTRARDARTVSVDRVYIRIKTGLKLSGLPWMLPPRHW
jgi:hypothetical protein